MMNGELSFQRQTMLKCIVDLLLGFEDAPVLGDGYDPIMDEDFVSEFASNMPISSTWWVLPVDNCINYAINSYNQMFSRFRVSEQTFTPIEMHYMRDDLIKRFKCKLKPYARGRRIAVKVFDTNRVGFRWEM